MKKKTWRALTATMLVCAVGASAQIEPEMEAASTAPTMAHEAPAPRAALDRRLETALDLDQDRRAHLEQLRRALRGQLQAIRAQAENGQVDEEQARWQVRMALAEHRQSRAVLLTDEQTHHLEAAYNARAQRNGRQANGLPTVLQLSEAQEEQMRMLLWSQNQEWHTLQESPVPPTAEQKQALRRAHRVAFEHLLSSKQFEILEHMKNARRRHHGLEEEVPVDAPMLLDDAPDTDE